MRKQLYTRWWKWLGAGLVLFSLVAGLLVPVGPGIESFSPKETQSGDTLYLTIYGYNSHFAEAEGSNQVFLRKDDTYLCATHISIASDGELIAHVPIPTSLPSQLLDVVVNNEVDGTFAVRNAVAVRNANPSPTGTFESCSPEVTTNEPTYTRIPYRIVLYETIRNLFYHVPMWFGMTFLVLVSFIYSIQYLRKEDMDTDILAAESANIGILFGLLGFATGTLWGHYAWGNVGDWMLQDTKILGALVGMIMYLAYFVLRGSLRDEHQRARIGAVYNIFAFVLYILFIFILPRMTETLHPGSGGNPAFNIYDVDDTMRWIFYPAVAGWILTGLWLASLRARMRFLKRNSDL